MMTIVERALELIPERGVIGLGSGRAAEAFVRLFAERMVLNCYRCVATSEPTARLARSLNIPLIHTDDVESLDVTIDGADEVDEELNLIKGYGRALVREKIVAVASKQFIILVGEEKCVAKLGTRGRLPVEVNPFGRSWVGRHLQSLGIVPSLDVRDGVPFTTDNGNNIFDCRIEPLDNPRETEAAVRSIAGVVETGFFLGMANTVLIGRQTTWELLEERRH